MNVDRTAVLMSIRPIYADRILDGTKTIEFRRKPLPESVKTVLMWRTGLPDGNGIVGKFTVAWVECASVLSWTNVYSPVVLGISQLGLAEYAGGMHAQVWGIQTADVTSAQGVVDPKTLHPALHRAPQSWRYAPEGWETRLEVPW
jgi:predicted transcriptional regulator